MDRTKGTGYVASSIVLHSCWLKTWGTDLRE